MDGGVSKRGRFEFVGRREVAGGASMADGDALGVGAMSPRRSASCNIRNESALTKEK